MESKQAIFSFGGIIGVESGNFTFSTGVYPSVCSISVVPQSEPPPLIGSLFIHYGSDSIEFPNCLFDSASSQVDNSGSVISMQILDRRWSWKYGFVNGIYNTINPDKTIKTGTEKTPQQLAGILLAAMGESSFDVSQIPNSSRPSVEWVYANPADELQSLSDSLGCRVVLKTDNTVCIARKGEQGTIPDFSIVNKTQSINPGDIPNKLRIVFGETRFQHLWKTEAVGEDVDGSIKTIDSLSYIPSDGFEKDSIRDFPNVLVEYGEEEQSLAKKSVFKWYRLITTFDTGLIERDKAKFEDNIIEVDINPSTGEVVKKPAIAAGEYWQGGGDYKNSQPYERIDSGFSVSKDGIARFSEPIVKLVQVADTITQVEADVFILTSYSLSKRSSTPFEREFYTFVFSQGENEEIVVDNDFELQFIKDYSLNSIQVSSSENYSELLQRANQIFLLKSDEYQDIEGFSVKYAEIFNISPSGSIMQVGWQFGESGGTTTISVNSEFDTFVRSELATIKRANENILKKKTP